MKHLITLLLTGQTGTMLLTHLLASSPLVALAHIVTILIIGYIIKEVI